MNDYYFSQVFVSNMQYGFASVMHFVLVTSIFLITVSVNLNLLINKIER